MRPRPWAHQFGLIVRKICFRHGEEGEIIHSGICLLHWCIASSNAFEGKSTSEREGMPPSARALVTW